MPTLLHTSLSSPTWLLSLPLTLLTSLCSPQPLISVTTSHHVHLRSGCFLSFSQSQLTRSHTLTNSQSHSLSSSAAQDLSLSPPFQTFTTAGPSSHSLSISSPTQALTADLFSTSLQFLFYFFFNMSLWEYEMFVSIFLFGVFYLNYGLQQMGCAISSYCSLKTWNSETLWCNCNILWKKLCILCFVFVVNAVPKRRWETKMNLGFIQKKNFGWPQFGPRAKRTCGARGARRSGSGPREKNPINNRARSGSWVHTRGSGLGMQKPSPNSTRCHSYPLLILKTSK